MSKIKSLKELKINKTYQACNYDVTFSNMYITPIKITENKLIYENAARRKITVTFKNLLEEQSFFNFYNLYEV